MLHDPSDETHRKPRQLRNTPLQKYVRFAAFAITICYAGAMYISWRKNIVPLLNDEEKISEFLENEGTRSEDYIAVPFLSNTIQKLTNLQGTILKANVELQNTQAKTESQDTQAKVE